MKNIKNLYIFFMTYFALTSSFVYAIELDTQLKKVPIEMKNNSAVMGEDLVKYKNMYASNGSVLIVAKGLPLIDSEKTENISRKQVVEIQKYLKYWLSYWNVRIKPADFVLNINSNIHQDETIVITLIGKPDQVFLEKESDQINNILKNLQTKSEIVKVVSPRVFEIKLDALFLDTMKADLNFSASFVLDNIIDIIKIYGDNTIIKLLVNKKPIFLKDKNIKNLLGYASKFSNLLQEKGLDKTRIHLLAKEDENLEKSKMELYFLQDFLATKNELELFLSKIYLNLEDTEENTKKKNKDIQNQYGLNRFYIYKDFLGENAKFMPTGWLGDVNDLVVDFSNKDAVYEGQEAIKISYRATGSQGWAGIQWQYPANNWGNNPEAIDLKGYSKLVFYAKGSIGGEKIAEVKIGGIKGKYSDSDTAWIGNIRLSSEWKRYEISLKDKDLSKIIGGFSFVLTKFDNRYGCNIYLDEIYFE